MSSNGSFQAVSSSRYLKVLRRLASSNSLKSLCFSQVQPDVSTKNARELENVSFSKPDGRSALFRQMVVQICSIRSRPLSTLSSQSRQTPRDEPKMETIQVRFLKKNVSQPLVYFDPLQCTICPFYPKASHASHGQASCQAMPDAKKRNM